MQHDDLAESSALDRSDAFWRLMGPEYFEAWIEAKERTVSSRA